MVQWLRLHAFTAEGFGSISGQGTKILQATQRSQKKKKHLDTSVEIVVNKMSHLDSGDNYM